MRNIRTLPSRNELRSMFGNIDDAERIINDRLMRGAMHRIGNTKLIFGSLPERLTSRAMIGVSGEVFLLSRVVWAWHNRDLFGV